MNFIDDAKFHQAILREIRPTAGESLHTLDELEISGILSTCLLNLEAIIRAIDSITLHSQIQYDIDMYSDEMLGYSICEATTGLYSEIKRRDFESDSQIQKFIPKEFNLKLFRTLCRYLEIIANQRSEGADIWKRTIDAIWAICSYDPSSRHCLEDIWHDNQSINSSHWSGYILSHID